MQQSSLRLQIPYASPSGSSINSPNAHTGRPPMWTKSAQRKLVRLYLYTTLPVEKILDVVYMHSADGPGRDSGNKTLNFLLNKEPRWLRPRSRQDMGHRLKQLALSMRSSKSTSRCCQKVCFTSTCAPPSRYFDTATSRLIKNEFAVSPAEMDSPVPRFDTHSGQHVSPGRAFAQETVTVPNIQQRSNSEEHIFSHFVRRDTVMSTDSDETNGSYHETLENYSEPYIKVVKRLMKRYTISNTEQSDDSHLSPCSDQLSPSIQRWLDDQDCAPRYQSSPFPLAGDFLHIDQCYGNGACQEDSDQHRMRRCFCYAFTDADSSPWVMSTGLTERAMRVLRGKPRAYDAMKRDAAGNTILHFMAARAGLSHLWETVQSRQIQRIFNERNTAGQTFLHVLPLGNPHVIESLPNLLCDLHQQGFDIFASDHYGRNIFHLLYAAEVNPVLIYKIMQPWSQLRTLYNTRDAFGNSPMPIAVIFQDPFTQPELAHLQPPELPFSPPPTPPHVNLDEDQSLLQSLQHPDPKYEDSLGRNALHCLAACKLSMLSMMEKYHMSEESITRARRHFKDKSHPQYSSYQTEDSTTRLKLRMSLAEGLISQGVDVNHYNHAGHTPLMAFAAELPEAGDYKIGPSIIKLLIAHGANVDARSASGETALHVAARCGRKLAMRTLVESSANVHARDSAGRSILDVIDVKLASIKGGDADLYARYEACRAWLSGSGRAVQSPSMMDEWRI